MAFVLIQHLDPKHESHLTELLSKASKMPVSEVQGETPIAANHVYVIPPQCNLSISDGVLHAPPRPASGRNMPIDSFFLALAEDRGSKALGVVLSGTATDGTLGLKAIKAAGGISFAQEMKTAKCEGMPGSAIAAGVVDFVLPPSGIAQHLAAIARDAHVRIGPPEDSRSSQDTPVGAQRHRSGLHPLQAQHARSTHQAAHGSPRLRETGRLHPGDRKKSRGSERLVRDLLYHRHAILSRASGF